MTREECEKRIIEKLEEIAAIYSEYHGDTNYLTMFIMENHISVCNCCNKDDEKPIDAWQNPEWGFSQG